MSKRLTSYEKVDNFIVREHDKQVYYYNIGLDNNVDEWEDLLKYWNLINDLAILKKKAKVLEIIINKQVYIRDILESENVEEYNHFQVDELRELSAEEYKTIKEMMNNENI